MTISYLSQISMIFSNNLLRVKWYCINKTISEMQAEREMFYSNHGQKLTTYVDILIDEPHRIQLV